jgi:hypothetical protein
VPRLVLTVPETDQSVTRPVVLDITRQLFTITGLPDNTIIYYPGDMDRAAQPGSVIGKESDVNYMPFSDKVTVEVDENYEQDRILSSAVYRPENLFIFRDDRIETDIKPVYSSTDVVLSFHYRAVDKVSATRWRDDIKTRVSMMRDVRIHDLSYYYLIPPEFLVILKEIHRMREAVDGYGEDYDTYFKANATQRASILTTQTGSQPMWGISETQMRVVGVFDFEGGPEKGSKEDDGDTWTISFSYKFKYDKPVACTMAYPLMVHNQLVDQAFRPDKPVDTPDRHVRSYSLSAANFHSFEKGTKLIGVPQGIAIPDFDEFIPSSTQPQTLRVFSALVSIDSDLPLLSLEELGSVTLHPEIVTFLRGEVNYLTKPRLSIFGIQLYRNIDLMPNDSLIVTPDLVVDSTKLLSTRDYHHIRLSIQTDLSKLTQAALDRAREHGIALQLIIEAIDPSLKDKGLIPAILSGNYITKIELQKAIDEMTHPIRVEGDNQIRQFNTVENLLIIASRRS